MSAIIKPTPEKKERKPKRVVGDKLICVKSHSNAYTEGKTYGVVEHPLSGDLCLQGNDKIYDQLGMLISVFKKVE